MAEKVERIHRINAQGGSQKKKNPWIEFQKDPKYKHLTMKEKSKIYKEMKAKGGYLYTGGKASETSNKRKRVMKTKNNDYVYLGHEATGGQTNTDDVHEQRAKKMRRADMIHQNREMLHGGYLRSGEIYHGGLSSGGRMEFKDFLKKQVKKQELEKEELLGSSLMSGGCGCCNCRRCRDDDSY